MELKEFLDKYPAWLQRNGIQPKPSIKKAEWTGVAGIEPPTLMIWTNSLGFTLTQGAEVISSQPEMPRHGLVALRSFYELAPLPGDNAEVSWQDFINPPAPAPGSIEPQIGAPVDAALVAAYAPSGMVSAGQKYYLMGGLDVPVGHIYTDKRDGKKYMSINPGSMFTRWLMQL